MDKPKKDPATKEELQAFGEWLKKQDATVVRHTIEDDSYKSAMAQIDKMSELTPQDMRKTYGL